MSVLHDVLRSENAVQDGCGTSWQTDHGGFRLSGVSSCCERWVEAVQTNWPGKCGQVTKPAAINLIWKPRCSQWSDCFQRSPHSQNSECHTGHRGKWLLHVTTVPLEDRWTVSAEWYMHLCLPKFFEVWCQHHPERGLHGLFLHHDMTWHDMLVTTHSSNSSFFYSECAIQQLPHPPYCATPLFLQLLLVPRGEKTSEGDPVWECWRCMLSIHEDCWRLNIATWGEEWHKWFTLLQCV